MAGFDDELYDTLVAATLLDEVDLRPISQFDLDIAFLDVDVEDEVLLFCAVDLVFVGFVFIEKIADGHSLSQLHFWVLGLRVETDFCGLYGAEFDEHSAS